MGNCQTISRTLYSLICPLGNRKWNCLGSDQEFGRLNWGTRKRCSIPIGMWDVIRVQAASLVLFLILWDSRNCLASVAQWLAHQHPNDIDPTRASVGPTIHQPILMTLSTSCEWPMMGEVWSTSCTPVRTQEHGGVSCLLLPLKSGVWAEHHLYCFGQNSGAWGENLVAAAKILEHEVSISPSSFHG